MSPDVNQGIKIHAMIARIDFKTHAETAWQLTVQHLVSLLLLTLATAAVGALSLGLFAPAALAGYFQALLRLAREGREPRWQDVFSQAGLALPLLVFTLASGVLTAFAYALLILPGIAVALAISFSCIYVVPLMVDQGLGLIDAIVQSYRMATAGNHMDQLLVILVVIGLSSIGGSVMIGWMFTQPLATLFLASVYTWKAAQPLPPRRSLRS